MNQYKVAFENIFGNPVVVTGDLKEYAEDMPEDLTLYPNETCYITANLEPHLTIKFTPYKRKGIVDQISLDVVDKQFYDGAI